MKNKIITLGLFCLPLLAAAGLGIVIKIEASRQDFIQAFGFDPTDRDAKERVALELVRMDKRNAEAESNLEKILGGTNNFDKMSRSFPQAAFVQEFNKKSRLCTDLSLQEVRLVAEAIEFGFCTNRGDPFLPISDK